METHGFSVSRTKLGNQNLHGPDPGLSFALYGKHCEPRPLCRLEVFDVSGSAAPKPPPQSHQQKLARSLLNSLVRESKNDLDSQKQERYLVPCGAPSVG